MEAELVDLLMKKTIKDYDWLHFIWHGGEPLLLGVNFYKNVIEIEKRYNVKVTNALQTNATLLTDEYAKLFVENQFGIGFSYDGYNNEETRGQTELVLNGINVLKCFGFRLRAIKVVLKEDLKNLKSTYRHFNNLGIDVRLNAIFGCGTINSHSNYSCEDFGNAMKDLFCYWIEDEKCSIQLQPFENYLSMAMGGKHRDCANASCLLSFISMDINGDLYPCTRLYERNFCYGNIRDIKSIKDIYQSKGFENIAVNSIQRRKKCLDECSLFAYCQGGCNHDAYVENGGQSNKFFSCAVFKDIFNFILNNLHSFNIKNPMIKNNY